MVEPLEFRALSFTLLTPSVGCPTADVYRRWDELGGPAGENGNDLEPAALDLVPDLARWRDDLGDATGLCPRLAGSGGTWFVEGEYPGGGRPGPVRTPAERRAQPKLRLATSSSRTSVAPPPMGRIRASLVMRSIVDSRM